MSDKKNDEKLKILQERLKQIKQKQDSSVIRIKEKEQPSSTSEETILPTPSKSYGWVKYIIIAGAVGIISIGAIGIWYYISTEPITLFSKTTEEKKEFVLTYDLNIPTIKINMKQIAITGSFNNENEAKAMRNNLRVNGYQSDYFFLPDHSNSEESPEPETLEIYKVFIGPFENQEETNQWTEKLESAFEIVSL